MTDPGENGNDKRGSGCPGWLPSGYTWNLALVLFGFVTGLAFCFWLFTQLGWW